MLSCFCKGENVFSRKAFKMAVTCIQLQLYAVSEIPAFFHLFLRNDNQDSIACWGKFITNRRTSACRSLCTYMCIYVHTKACSSCYKIHNSGYDGVGIVNTNENCKSYDIVEKCLLISFSKNGVISQLPPKHHQGKRRHVLVRFNIRT
uniref:Uncharacterized protein n=1 Tax=Glossina palpalis gambiensis TaxID=67801 RepID=A0A1B0B6H6_9MUSC